MNLTFEQFEKYLNMYIEQEDSLNKLMGAIEDYFGGALEMPKHDTAVVDMLEDICHDTQNGWISYWLWELDRGKNWEPGYVQTPDGKDVKLQSVEDLYNLLVEDYEE